MEAVGTSLIGTKQQRGSRRSHRRPKASFGTSWGRSLSPHSRRQGRDYPQRFTTPWVVIASARVFTREFESRWVASKSWVSPPRKDPISVTRQRFRRHAPLNDVFGAPTLRSCCLARPVLPLAGEPNRAHLPSRLR